MTTTSSAVFRCPTCHGELTETSEGLWCSHCDRSYVDTGDYVDFLQHEQSSETPVTDYLFKFIPPLYDNYYFPFLYRLGTLPRSFSPRKQAERLVERTTAQQSTVLDVACGTGMLTRALANVNRRVFALDRSGAMIRQAIDNTPYSLSDKIKFCRGDALELPFEKKTFHALTCSGAFYFFPDLPGALDEMYRVLKSGSHLAGMTVVKQGILGNSVSKWLLKLYGTIGTYNVHETESFERSIKDAGFTDFDYERHGAILIFDAKKP